MGMQPRDGQQMIVIYMKALQTSKKRKTELKNTTSRSPGKWETLFRERLCEVCQPHPYFDKHKPAPCLLREKPKPFLK